jgi:hypothetical protein
MAEAIQIGYPGVVYYNVDLSAEYVRIKNLQSNDFYFGPPVNAVITLRGPIGSTSPSSPALVTGNWPYGSTVTLVIPANIAVYGAGGAGGGGTGTNPVVRVAAGTGGTAIEATRASTVRANAGGPVLNVINNGVIGGGGGGGGAGYLGNDPYTIPCGGGGGGGAGPGAGGASYWFPGQTGSGPIGGAGGVRYQYNGGSGGNVGTPGTAGRGDRVANDGAPGLAGRSFKLNGNTISVTGTGQEYGTRS